jgi:hypothetical protein
VGKELEQSRSNPSADVYNVASAFHDIFTSTLMANPNLVAHLSQRHPGNLAGTA